MIQAAELRRAMDATGAPSGRALLRPASSRNAVTTTTPSPSAKRLTVGEATDVDALTSILSAGNAAIGAPCRDSPAWLKWCPLHAAAKERPQCVQLLLSAGADPNARTADGKTAMMLAAAYGRWPAVQLLLDAGADVRATNNDGMTALDFATAAGGAPSAILSALRGA